MAQADPPVLAAQMLGLQACIGQFTFPLLF